jgi:hypothetical protein
MPDKDQKRTSRRDDDVLGGRMDVPSRGDRGERGAEP